MINFLKVRLSNTYAIIAALQFVITIPSQIPFIPKFNVEPRYLNIKRGIRS